jgi:hypothetical protein
MLGSRASGAKSQEDRYGWAQRVRDRDTDTARIALPWTREPADRAGRPHDEKPGEPSSPGFVDPCWPAWPSPDLRC